VLSIRKCTTSNSSFEAGLDEFTSFKISFHWLDFKWGNMFLIKFKMNKLIFNKIQRNNMKNGMLCPGEQSEVGGTFFTWKHWCGHGIGITNQS
jgi:hypothetical protein